MILELTSPAEINSVSALRRAQVFPSGEFVPENLLRFHIFFDTPGFSDQVLSAVRLIDNSGNEVPHAFLDLAQGLWDPTGTRLTLLLHPGRIKSGLQSNLSMGSVLTTGQTYCLMLNMDMLLGAANRGIQAHTFKVSSPSTSAIDFTGWQLSKPSARTYEALQITFDRTMDRMGLDNAFSIQDDKGRYVRFRLSIGRNERTVLLTPLKSWGTGGHSLIVRTDMEDVGGNRLQAGFQSTAAHGLTAPPSERTMRFLVGT
jgi:hypothetical protein